MSRLGKAVTLRQRERQGVVSLYLTIRQDGKRRDEYLGLYLYPSTDRATKMRNNETLREAERICAQRLVEVEGGNYNADARKVTLRILLDQSKHNAKLAVLRELESCALADLPLPRITSANLLDLRTRLLARLASSSVKQYESLLRRVTRDARLHNIISIDPYSTIPILQADSEPRTYLTSDELKTLIATPCNNTCVRKLFLFACLTGLRWSDLKQLKWGDIKSDGSIVIRQTKTKQIVTTYLREEARSIIGDNADKNALVFPDIPTNSTCNRVMLRWALKAKLSKYITFHTSRHTFATLLLAQGADIYTVSRLLGHTSVTSTQIYAEVLDESKRKAINNLPRLDI